MNMGNSNTKPQEMNDTTYDTTTNNNNNVDEPQRKWSFGLKKGKQRKGSKNEQTVNGHPKFITSTSHAIDEQYSGQIMAPPLDSQLSTKSANHPNNLPLTPNGQNYGSQKHGAFSPSYKLRTGI